MRRLLLSLCLSLFAATLSLVGPATAADGVVVYDAEGTAIRFTLPPESCAVDGDSPAEARLRSGAAASAGARRLALLWAPCAERERLRGDASARAQAFGQVGLFGTPVEVSRRYAPLPSAPEAKSQEWLEIRLALLDGAMRGAGEEPAASLPADETGNHLLVLRKDGQNKLSVELRSIAPINGFLFHVREFLPTADAATVFAALSARRDWIRRLQDLNAGS